MWRLQTNKALRILAISPAFSSGSPPDPVPSLHLQINCGCFAKKVKLKAAVVNRR
jgi:hypothetical protein